MARTARTSTMTVQGSIKNIGQYVYVWCIWVPYTVGTVYMYICT